MRLPLLNKAKKRKPILDFQETAAGYSRKTAVEQARRCPQGRDPSHIPHCPLGIDIPGFIRFLREGDIKAALRVIREQNDLPAVCGRICSAPCEKSLGEGHAPFPVPIRILERYAADHGQPLTFSRRERASGRKVAVVGSGPAGLTVAAQLARRGYQVTVLESLPYLGGALRFGVPGFRLPSGVLQTEIRSIESLGVVFKTNQYVGQSVTLAELFKEGFAAVVLAVGAGMPPTGELPGAHLVGVFYSQEILWQVNFLKKLRSRGSPLWGGPNAALQPKGLGRKVAVIGSANQALDCGRVLVRWGKEATVLVEGTEDEMAVYPQERGLAKEEGVVLETLARPEEILGNDQQNVSGLRCVRQDFADPDSTGQWKLIPVPESDFLLTVDSVVIAGPARPGTGIRRYLSDLKWNAGGTVWVDEENSMTSVKGLFACGSAVIGDGDLVQVMASAKKTADKVDKYFKK